MKIVGVEQIKEVLPSLDLLPLIEEGFVAYSEGRAVVPAVGELLFENPPGDVHIKYGYLVGDAYYLIKIASGFYENPALGLSSSNGLLLLFSQKTGALLSILLDEGYLTDLRTAVAGAIAARYLAPRKVQRIGIVGTGIQARMQLQQLKHVTDCRDVMVWGRSREKLTKYSEDLKADEFSILTTQDIRDVPATCNLIVTTTPATSPLLTADQIQPGTHITAVGADTSYKQELAISILQRSHLVVADSIKQCMERGEISHALRENVLQTQKLVELGQVISGKVPARTADDQVTVVDLTGIVVQDVQIARAVYEAIYQ